MKRYVTAGPTVLTGAALFEAALIPDLVIGAAAVLAPISVPTLAAEPTALRAPAAAGETFIEWISVQEASRDHRLRHSEGYFGL
jgi:hypothetical protein